MSARWIIPLVLSFGLLPSALRAAGGCPGCGCMQGNWQRRVVCETVPVVVWEHYLQTDPVCLPGRSCVAGEHPLADPRSSCTTQPIWKPTCGKVVERQVLMKRPVIVQKQVTRCVVEATCPSCGIARREASSEPLDAKMQLFPDPANDQRALVAWRNQAATPPVLAQSARPNPAGSPSPAGIPASVGMTSANGLPSPSAPPVAPGTTYSPGSPYPPGSPFQPAAPSAAGAPSWQR